MVMSQLYDDGPMVVAVSGAFIGVATLLVSLRQWVRWVNGTMGLDDYCLLLGLVLWIVSTSFVFPAAWNGLGAHTSRYGPGERVEALKMFFLFQDLYVWANIPIKTSLCLTIIRVSDYLRWVSWTLYGLMFAIAASSVGANVYLLTACSPVAASWDTGMAGARCRPAEGTLRLGNAYSAINIVVDWAVALLPVFLLWRVKMAWRKKLVVMGILALGIFASCATLVRLRTLTNFTNQEDYLYGLGAIVTWTVTESGLALIAGSLVAFRPLVRRWFGGSTGAASEPAYEFTPRRTRAEQSGKLPTSLSRGADGGADMDIGLATIVRAAQRQQSSHRWGAAGAGSESQEDMVNKGERIKVTRTISVKG